MHRRQRRSVGRTLASLGLAVCLAIGGQLVLLPSTAFAATVLTVTTTADTSASGGACGDAGIVVAANPLSLREATCLANNLGGTVSITIPSGTYLLNNGELQPGIASGQNVSYLGAGAASTIINAQGLNRVIDIDEPIVGSVTMTISGLTVTGGADSTFGGAGIIAGSGNQLNGDVLTLSNVTVTGNNSNAGGPTVTNKPGGGVQFLGGQLTITNSTISNNSSLSSQGGGVVYSSNGGGVSPEGLTVTNTVFSGNTMTNTSSGTAVSNGGALALRGGSTTPFTISNSVFRNNTVSATTGPAIGAAIWQQSGVLTVTESSFTGNSVSGGAGSPTGGAVGLSGGSATLNYDRFVGNTATTGQGVGTQNSATVNAVDSWWGCNAGPGSAGCDTVAGAVTAAPRLVLTASANPPTIIGPNGTSTITGSLVTDSASANVGPANLDAFAALPVSFSDPPGDATVTLTAGAHTAGFSAGVASIDYHPNTTVGPSPVNVTFDNQTVGATVNVNAPPTITSANNANFNIGTAGTFTVTTTGFPTPTLTTSSTLPAGVTFVDQGDGTAKLSGTPPAGSGGTYNLAIVASNGVSPNATQTFTLTIGAPPAFTSAATATFTAGSAGSFTVTTSGVPTVAAITRTGTLPAGLTFTDNGNGTATLAGTPAAGSGGTYPITLGAANGVTPNATQTLTIQVNQAPVITTNPSSQTVNPGASVSFTAAASGVPTPTVQWQRNTGSGYVNIPGATSTTYTFTAAGGDSGNLYHAVFTNSAGSATSASATLTVGSAPTISSANTTTFTVGVAGSFTVTTSGFPNPAITVDASTPLPAWLTLTAGPGGTATLTGTPPAGSGGPLVFQLDAQNGFTPSATQTFTLLINQAPTITSADHATFTVGTPGSFAVTTTAGFPVATGFTITPALPAGLTLVNQGNGTALLQGTPPAGFGGVHTYTIGASATGGTTAPSTQTFTLTVDESPTFSSADHATFTVGVAGSFTVAAPGAFPADPALSVSAGLPTGVTFVDNGDGTGTLQGTPGFGTGGTYPLTFTANPAGTAASKTQAFTLTVEEPPTITSTDHATFASGTSESFTITTAGGQPAGPITITVPSPVDLPPGVALHDLGNGTATIDGIPTGGGVYAFTITASNGVLPPASQLFTLTVTQRPAITSADHATFTVGSAGSFTVTSTAGTPTARSITEVGALPDGITLTDQGDGTALLAGTPAAGTGGSYPFTITAENAAGPVTQNFVLTILEPTAISSTDHVTFAAGVAGTFSVTTSGGFPTPPVLSETGALPAGVSFVDNGDGTATVSGTPALGEGGSYPLTITANNGVAPNATQAFTLTVNEAPVITSADHVTFDTGIAGTFTVTTTAGTPPVTTLTGPTAAELPAGVTFVPHADGTATLAGTPAVGTGGEYAFDITASNTTGSAVQHFTLTVDELPTFTSANSTTFTVGAAGSFAVTTVAGFPAGTVLSSTGALPPGVTFVDNGDGTATLAGTPAAGSGGAYPLGFNAANDAGSSDQAFMLTIADSPTFTSADHASFEVGVAGSFTVTANRGVPANTTLTESGALPAGITFSPVTFLAPSPTVSATFSGTPAVGTGGVYHVTVTASNGVAPAVTQAITITVTELPAFSSASSTVFAVGTAGTFGVTTVAGFPAATAIVETGALPAGITFTDNGDGTATLAGTPAAGTGGAYPLTLTAANSAGATQQSFDLTVNESPTITSANQTTFTAGVAGTFTVITAGGFPTPPALTASGDLPDGVTFTDNGDGTATLAGTPTSGGTYPLGITAGNGVTVEATQTLTLVVNGPPSITSADVMTFTAGVAGTFAVTARPGVPASPTTLSETGALPSGVTFTDNGDGTATLAGTAPIRALGNYPLTLSASNGVDPAGTQAFVLHIVRAAAVPLPTTPPVSSGPLGGVPPVSTAGQLLQVSGSGFAAGAPITIVAYGSLVVLGRTVADANGNFSTTIRVPAGVGTRVYVASGIGANGKPRFVTASSTVLAAVVVAPIVPPVTPVAPVVVAPVVNGGDSIAYTGSEVRLAVGYGLAVLLAGAGLLAIGRRRRRT